MRRKKGNCADFSLPFPYPASLNTGKTEKEAIVQKIPGQYVGDVIVVID